MSDPTSYMSKMPSITRLITFFAAGAGLAVLGLVAYGHLSGPAGQHAPAENAAAAPVASAAVPVSDDWTVGELRPNGLRIRPSGRSDASHVLDPAEFTDPVVRNAYQIAHEIPATLNKLYCWCGCENRGVHRSNLGCFEDKMAVRCGVCRGTAEIAHAMIQDGTTDAGAIQAAVDMNWGPERAKKEQQELRGDL